MSTLRDKAVSFVQHDLDQTASLPDDELGKPSVSLPQKSILIGVLEDVPGKYQGQPNSRHVRVVFEKDAATWMPFPANCPDQACLKKFPSDFPSQVAWTIAFDGRNLGQLTTHVPHEYEYYADAGLQDVVSKEPIPTEGQRSEKYGGFLGAAVYRPLVANSQPYFSDPDAWKPTKLSPSVVPLLRGEFRKRFPKVENCANPDENIARTWRYRDQDIEIGKAYSSNKKWVLASLSLRGNNCDGPPEDAFSGQWFVVNPENHIELLGQDMWLVDAGDYDNDGRSEVVFAIAGYDAGGYVLYFHDFKKHVDFEFSYH